MTIIKQESSLLLEQQEPLVKNFSMLDILIGHTGNEEESLELK